MYQVYSKKVCFYILPKIENFEKIVQELLSNINFIINI